MWTNTVAILMTSMLVNISGLDVIFFTVSTTPLMFPLSIFTYNLNKTNRISGVMVCMFVSSVVDRGFESWSDQTKYYEIGIC